MLRVTPALSDFAPVTLGLELELETLLFEDAFHLLGHFAVHARQRDIEKLDDGHFGTETAPYGAEFETDDPGADDDHRLRHLRQ